MKYDPSLNDEQNEAVYSRDGSILVSAPAGSGKTKILVNRMMSLIEDDGVNVDNLLVLTFTKAAALEMKQRLVESLNKRIEQLEDGSLKNHLIKQLPLLNDAYITNFHSFCSDILTQYGHAINLDTQFTIVSDPTLIKMRVFDECLETWTCEEPFQKFFVEHYADYNFTKFKNIILKLDTLTHNIYHFDDYFNKMKEELYEPVLLDNQEDAMIVFLLRQKLKDAYQEGFDAYMDLISHCDTYDLDFFTTPTKKAPSVDDVLKEYYRLLEKEFEKPLFEMKKVPMEKHRNGVFKDISDQVKNKYNTLLKKAKTSFNDVYDKCMPASFDDLKSTFILSLGILENYLLYVRRFQEAYKDYKKQHSYLDFNDLEEYGLQLLDKDVGVSQTLYHQFHEIMIDEYQDSATCCAISH